MADCRIVNTSCTTAVDEIKKISDDYKKAGEDFVSEFVAAIGPMEGATKDALETFIKTTANEFLAVSLPSAVEGASQLLEANRKNFEDVDTQIASSISA